MQMKSIYTVGHSSHDADFFIGLIELHGIVMVVDIRRYPRSRRYPQFNQSDLQRALRKHDICYTWMEALGGRRYEGYGTYMNSVAFKDAVSQLESFATSEHTVFMCAEESPLQCHRYHVSDVLVRRGWRVFHIRGDGVIIEHQEQLSLIVE